MCNELYELFDGCLDIDPALPQAALNELPSCKGVVLFADSAEAPIQLIIASNIRRMARAKLLPPEQSHSKRPDLAENTRKVYYLKCFNDFRSYLMQYKIACLLWPENYTDHVSLPKLWYVKINPCAKWPFFSVGSSSVVRSDEKIFGPFCRSKDAREFQKTLEEAFGLCRMPSLLGDISKASSCPYLQMETCCGVCTGKTSPAQYAERINTAVSVVSGDIGEYMMNLESRMQLLSSELKFEQARDIKKRIDELELLKKDKYRWITELRQLRILHIDVSEKIKIAQSRKKVQSYSAFLIRLGQIEQLNDFTIDLISQLCESLETTVASAPNLAEDFGEQFSVVGRFLYRDNTSGLWLNAKELSTAETIEAAMRQAFAQL